MTTKSLLIGLVACAALAGPAVSNAATLETDGGTLVFRGADGEKNDISLQSDTPTSVTVYTGTTQGQLTSYPGTCDPHLDWGYVTCPVGPGGVKLELNDGDDFYATSSDLPENLKIVVNGGPGTDWIRGSVQHETFNGGDGDDKIEGSNGNDTLDGGDGADNVDGYAGSDHVSGGAGDDILTPDYYERPSADVVDGGPGVDTIESDYSSRYLDSDQQPNVAITLGGGADDGRPGENDDVKGVERLWLSVGGKVVGGDAGEYVKLHQVAQNGELIGNGGNDELRGGDGEDRIDGGTGDDKLDGGFNDDVIVGGPGRDSISADLAGGDCGPLWCKYPYGNDTVDARDGEVDSITCGAGTDKVLADAADVVAKDCETVERAGAPAATATAPGQAAAGGAAATARAGGKPAAARRVTLSQKLRVALSKGLKLRISGLKPKARAAVRVLDGRRTVAKGTARSGADGTAKVTLRFTKAARRSLARKRTVKLTVIAPGLKETVTLAR